jgi:hypothetical protein
VLDVVLKLDVDVGAYEQVRRVVSCAPILDRTGVAADSAQRRTGAECASLDLVHVGAKRGQIFALGVGVSAEATAGVALGQRGWW